MKLLSSIVLLSTLFCSMTKAAYNEPDWSKNVVLSEGENRGNIFNLDSDELIEAKKLGIIHAEVYPVSVTGLLIPYKPLMTFLESKPTNPLKKLIYDLGKDYTGFYTEKDLYAWLGLSENTTDINAKNDDVFSIPYPNGKKDQFFLGAGIIKTNDGEGLTFSCLACHAQNMFGKVVVGLTNKRPHANTFFNMARGTVPHIPSSLFALSTNATKGEELMFTKTKKNLVAVDALKPQVLGLDTSLSQVALSLAHRNADSYATKSDKFEKNPRFNELSQKVADSKPLPWWNVKYKTRWLADGSIVQGNPILTNILWNEIGRGTDLVKLEKWMNENSKSINELTAAVFSNEAPHWTDFFDASTINLSKAKRGEIVFQKTCSQCHGDYEKNWSRADNESLSPSELLKTSVVRYHDRTPVKDVGTDPRRYEGIKYFSESLNNLAISKKMNTLVVPQKGYVPAPLVGIWMRYPYLHNNSIPNLCALLTPPKSRPVVFVQGPSLDAKTDFDSTCVGYPVGNKIPKTWLNDKEAYFDTRKDGLTNIGHYSMLLDNSGNELLTHSEKNDLIEFLKTL
jgi:hypothetical protein